METWGEVQQRETSPRNKDNPPSNDAEKAERQQAYDTLKQELRN